MRTDIDIQEDEDDGSDASLILKLPYTLENITAGEFAALKQAETGLLHQLRCTANEYWRPHFAGVSLYIDFELTPGSDTGSVYIYIQKALVPAHKPRDPQAEDTLAGAFHFALMDALHKIRVGNASI